MLFLAFPLALALLLAQARLPEFEVASIKPNKSTERMYYGLRNGALTIRNMPLRGIVQAAYGKRDWQIAGGPSWISSECFDIEAKAERPFKANQDMLKSLLAARFQLQLHKETKIGSSYSLTVAKSGLKMKPSTDQTEPDKGGPGEIGPGKLIGPGIPMYIIVNLLSSMLGAPVVDNTGLAGKFDLNLQTTLPDDLTDVNDLQLAIEESIEKQLGLKLESIKAPQEILVIDHIARPSAN